MLEPRSTRAFSLDAAAQASSQHQQFNISTDCLRLTLTRQTVCQTASSGGWDLHQPPHVGILDVVTSPVRGQHQSG